MRRGVSPSSTAFFGSRSEAAPRFGEGVLTHHFALYGGHMPGNRGLPPTGGLQLSIAHMLNKTGTYAILSDGVVYLSPADKYHRLTRRLSKNQKGLDERAL